MSLGAGQDEQPERSVRMDTAAAVEPGPVAVPESVAVPAQDNAAPDRLLVAVFSALMVVLLVVGWLMAAALVRGLPPVAVSAGRTASAFLVLLVPVAVSSAFRAPAVQVLRRPGTVALLAVTGFFLYYLGTLSGARVLGAAYTNVIVSLLPCITFVLGVAFFGGRLSWDKAVGTVTAFAAVAGYSQASGPDAGGLSAAAVLPPVMAALGGTAAYALYGLLYRRWLGSVPALAALPAITGLGTVFLLVAALPGGALAVLSPEDWGQVALLGGVFTAPVFVLAHELIRRRGPLFTSAIALPVPFLVRFGEWATGAQGPPGLLTLAFVALCVLGVWLTIRESAAKPASKGDQT